MVGALGALEADDRIVRGEFRPDGVRREWCDVDVLRQLRRRSLAVLRKEVEPVEQSVLAEFLPAWQGVGSSRKGLEPLVEALGVLAGAPIVASTLERDVLAARVSEYRPPLLDELCTSGEVVWVGAGAIGSNDGRVRLCFVDQLALLAPSWDAVDRPESALHDHGARRARLGRCELLVAAPCRRGRADRRRAARRAVGPRLGGRGHERFDGRAAGPHIGRGPTGVGTRGTPKRSGGAFGRARGRPSRLGRIGPATGAGRWSLVAPLLEPKPTATASAHAAAMQLVERMGVVTREGVLAEGVVGGFASVYGVLKVLEERGQVRRGYFVSGLGAAQFAVPGAVDRLRSLRRTDELAAEPGAPTVLSATDPAQPYGAALAWPDSPGRPARIGAAVVVVREGVPLVWHDRRSHHLVTFPAAMTDPSWVDVARVARARRRDAGGRDPQDQRCRAARVAGCGLGAGRRHRRRLHRQLPRPGLPPRLSVTAVPVTPGRRAGR